MINPETHHIIGRAALLLLVEIRAGLSKLEGCDDAGILKISRPSTKRDSSLRPLLKFPDHVIWKTNQLADHRCRKRSSHVANGIYGARSECAIKNLSNNLAYMLLKTSHRTRRKASCYQLATHLMLRVV